MKLLYQILAAGTLAMLATGCKDETPNYGQTGGGSSETVGYVDLNGLSPQVLLDAEINQTPAQTTAAQTRAVTEATPDYLVRIYNSSDECVLDTTYGDMQSQFNDGPEQNLLALPVGTYRLEVHSQEPSSVPDVEWEAPTYGTTYDFAVLRSHTSDSPLTIADEVVCKLSNIKVTVSISADLAELLGDDTKSTVTLGSAVAEFTKSESRAAYFRPQNSDGDTLEFKLTGTKDGKPAELSKTITGVKAGQWRKIMLSIVYAETGDIKIVVTVDSFVQDSEITINSTESLWEPELDEGTDRPTLTWPGHDLAQPVALDESMYDPSGTFNGTAPALTLSVQ